MCPACERCARLRGRGASISVSGASSLVGKPGWINGAIDGLVVWVCVCVCVCVFSFQL
jgi:hypothetical protein